MPISQYLSRIRSKVGNDLLVLPSVTALVWNTDRQLLCLQQEEGGPWTLPGGIVDPEEAPAQALVREVWEETGVKIRPDRIVGVFGSTEGFRRTYANQDQVEFVDVVFECHAVGGRLECRDGEAVTVRYFEVSEIAALPIAYPVNLATLIGSSGEPIFHWDEKWLAELGH
jgi:8-oxo-dGTP pyrophosphatase MutT (NUDIX family)